MAGPEEIQLEDFQKLGQRTFSGSREQRCHWMLPEKHNQRHDFETRTFWKTSFLKMQEETWINCQFTLDGTTVATL